MSTVERDDTRNETAARRDRRWDLTVTLWAAAVGVQGVILLLLAQHDSRVFSAMKLEHIASLLREGQTQDAARSARMPDYFTYPVNGLVHFALVGLAVIVLAWAGRRTLAALLPIAIAIVSLSPRFTTEGPATLQPISELGDGSLWQMLSLNTQTAVFGQPWPLVLGVVVQSALLLLPLAAAPRRQASTSLARATRLAVVPTAIVMVGALVAFDYSDVDELYSVPLIVIVIGMLSAGIATGVGSSWLRLPAAVLVPATLAVGMTPPYLVGVFEDFAAGLAVAVAAFIVTVGTVATPVLQGWSTSRDRPMGDFAPPTSGATAG